VGFNINIHHIPSGCRILHFILLLKKATAVDETSNTNFLASVNFLNIFLIFKLQQALVETWTNTSESLSQHSQINLTILDKRIQEKFNLIELWKF